MINTTHFIEETNDNSIAVIGMAGKFPGADTVEDFWQNIISKKETIHFFNNAELIDAGVDVNLLDHSHYVKARGILNNIEQFDAAFFNYSPSEARITDPQHRIFLQQTWMALENAGYSAKKFQGLIGLFAGMSDSSYHLHNLLNNDALSIEYDELQMLFATSAHFLATKVAYAMGLTGPCINVQTACSTGLVTIAMACDNLISYNCDMALAGAVTIITPQYAGYLYQESSILSPDGHCRAFDKDAQGTVVSNGCGVVVLKRLSDALASNDNIIAVIKGWAINNDGFDKAGFTAPSINGQASCISHALAFAGIEPTEIDYLETHGTGTLLGDPIEIAALTKAYQYTKYKSNQYCAIGSVKTNVGHTDSAAGVVGFIKTAMALNKKILPPSLHFTTTNEKIDFVHSPFYVNTETRPWVTTNHLATAAVNSLGFGGTNAHVIMQEPPVMESSEPKSAHLCILSAKTSTALVTACTNFTTYLHSISAQKDKQKILANAAYTLQLGREEFSWRYAITYQTFTDLMQQLEDPASLTAQTCHLDATQNTRVIFVFPGQGTQHLGMAKEIYEQQPYFKNIVDTCCQQLKEIMEIDFRDILFPELTQYDIANEKLRSTKYAQPALFIIEYALSQLLIEWGIKPSAMLGHSLGEYVAATLSGVLSLSDAIKIIAARATLMAKTAAGKMLAIPLSKEKITSFLNKNLVFAAYNTPELCIISGEEEDIKNFENSIMPVLAADDLSCSYLHTAHAFHSPLMDPILEAFVAVTRDVNIQTPNIPYLSNLTGTWINKTDLLDKQYWRKHLRQTVRFSENVQQLDLSKNDICIEIGPGQTLLNLIQQHQKNNAHAQLISTLPAPQAKQKNSYAFFLASIGTLWLHGKKIHWEKLYTNEQRQRIPLPTYPFETQHYWVNPDRSTAPLNKNSAKFLQEACYMPAWERNISLLSLPIKHDALASEQEWLLFAPSNSCLHMLENQLKLLGKRVYRIQMGAEFSELAQDIFTINPCNKSDYVTLLNYLNVSTNTIKVIHAWSYDEHMIEKENAQILSEGAYSLLYLSQASAEINSDQNLHIVVLANHVLDVLGQEKIYPAKATILGPCKVIPLEQKNVLCKFIDVDFESVDAKCLANSLAWEMENITRNTHSIEVAYRGIYRWIRRIIPCDSIVNTDTHHRLKRNGIYLITGGLGGIGLTIATHLAKQYHAHIILLSHASMAPKAEWDHVLQQHNESDKISNRIAQLKIIDTTAASLTILQAAVENEAQLTEALQAIHQKFEKLDGVIHAAGIAGGGMAQLKTTESYDKVLLPKLQGTQTLIKLLSHESLDFIVFFSSITATTGFVGQIDYCSANLVLDAYSTSIPFNHPTFCVTINWPAWRDVGMAVASTTRLTHLNDHNSITSDKAVLLFDKIVNGNLHQVIIAHESPDSMCVDIDNLSTADKKTANAPIKFQKNSTLHDQVIETLIEIWRNLLDIKEIGLDDDFAALGGHSLLAIRLLAKIHKQLGTKISLTALLEARTVRSLAKLIQSNTKEEISSIVTLQKGGTRPPLFIVHPIGGTVFCYLTLASHLKSDRTIYGLQDPGIAQEKDLFNTLEEMATHYCQAIQKIQPTGPYYLCGSSFGATVAVEIANQLLQKNMQVAFVGLIDGWSIFSDIQKSTAYIDTILHRHQENKDSRILPRETNNPQFWETMLKSRMKLMMNYQPKKINVPLYLFKAMEILPEYAQIETSDNHWGSYSDFPINVFHVPGNHNTILYDEQCILILANMIQTCIAN